MRPAALRAGVPRRIVQARHSSSPAVRKRHQVEQRVARLDEAIAGAGGEAQVGEEGGAVVGLELGDLGLDLRREHQRLRPRGLGPGGDVGGQRCRDRVLGDVQHDEQRPQREESVADERGPLLGRQVERP